MINLKNINFEASAEETISQEKFSASTLGTYSDLSVEHISPIMLYRLPDKSSDASSSSGTCTGFCIELTELVTKKLSSAIAATLEPDDNGFIARTEHLSIYGFGDTAKEAVDALKHEIESLYADLMEDDDFIEEWLSTKEFLRKRIVNG